MTQSDAAPAAGSDDAAAAFGRYLRSQRKLAKMSLRQLGDLASVSNPYLSQIERGLKAPSVAVITSIAKALNLSAEALLVQAAGIDPTAESVDGSEASAETEAAIRVDPLLDDAQKQALLAVYRSYVEGNRES